MAGNGMMSCMEIIKCAYACAKRIGVLLKRASPVALILTVGLIALDVLGAKAEVIAPAHFSAPPVGLKIEFNHERVFEFVNTCEKHVRHRVRYKSSIMEFESYGIFHQRSAVLASGRKQRTDDAFRDPIDRLWPLTIGKSATYDTELYAYTGCSGWDAACARRGPMLRNSIRVEGSETVTTPAGTFDAYIVSRTRTPSGESSSDSKAVTRFWYVPEIRWYVKYTFFRRHKGKETSVELEATRIEPPMTGDPPTSDCDSLVE